MKRNITAWLVAILALILVVAVVVLLVLDAKSNQRPALYRNLDGHLYSVNTQTRTPAEDGLYHMRFVYEGRAVEYTVTDQTLVNYIDSMEVMGLTISEEGTITNAFPADTIATEICRDSFIKSISPDQIQVNSSLAMNGTDATVRWNNKTLLCDVSRDGSVAVLPGALQPLDGISAYADKNGVVTHIFVTSHPTESPVYWIQEQMYNSSKQETTRECDENGVYTLDFYSDGKLVTLKCKDKALVSSIDSAASDASHFGFAFDKDGYIVNMVKSALGLRGLLACEKFDIIELTDTSVTAKKLISSKGESWTGSLAKNCKIYDISPAAQAENRMGAAVEALQLGDRVTIWTDTENRACEIYITNRLVDLPIYFNLTRKYDADKKVTSRTPDANGYYTVELLRVGDTEPVVFMTQDKDLMTTLDQQSSRCVSVTADSKGILQAVYPYQCLFGHSIWASGSVVDSITGSVVTKITYGKTSTAANAVMTGDCKVINTSTAGQLGAETELQEGDYIYAFRRPSGELTHIFVIRRCLGADTMYYNLNRQYDPDKQETTRECDENGVYSFTLAHAGQQVTLKTDNKELADLLDAYTPGAVSLVVEGDKILEVNDPKYACGGNQLAHNFQYKGVREDGQHVAVNQEEKESVFTMADNCVIYDVRNGVRQVSQLQAGDKLTCYTDRTGKVQIIFVR